MLLAPFIYPGRLVPADYTVRAVNDVVHAINIGPLVEKPINCQAALAIVPWLVN